MLLLLLQLMIMMLLIFSSISLSSAIHFYIYQACRLENFSSLSNIRLDPPFTDWPLEICILHATKRTETINELGKLLRSLPWISPSFALPSSPLQSLFLLSSYFRLLSLSLARLAIDLTWSRWTKMINLEGGRRETKDGQEQDKWYACHYWIVSLRYALSEHWRRH